MELVDNEVLLVSAKEMRGSKEALEGREGRLESGGSGKVLAMAFCSMCSGTWLPSS